jgi:predicted negative regulator of RcsB-dependent stress response
MASHLDLEEQEQIDQLKQFWNQYGNLITWTVIIALAAFAGWNGWNWWQREQAVKASALYDELDRAAQAGEADRAATLFANLKERFPRTAFAQQAGLLVAKVQFEKGQADNARATLTWVGENAVEDEYKTFARIRLAGVLLEQKKPDEALKQLDAPAPKELEPLVADRRGDVLMAQGKTEEAKAAYQKAWQSMDDKIEYRRLLEAKLTALGAPPDVAAPKVEAAK